ncbi:MAG: class I SAM-dependent methyltransferase [Pseudomonadota bacterium]
MHPLVHRAMSLFRHASLAVESHFDRRFLNRDVVTPKHVAHGKWEDHLIERFNRPGMRVLEVGSREVTGRSQMRARFTEADYVGFDYYPGPNVDVVGDAHKLGRHFPKDTRFDLIFTSACFEHFAMPWIVAREMVKLCKVGGHVFVETHFSFGAHERPWNFFQFSDMGLKVLFPRALGMECVEAGMSTPMTGRFSALADRRYRMSPIWGLYCHSEYFGRKVEEVDGFDWTPDALDTLVSNTRYPAPKIETETEARTPVDA